MSQNGTRRLWKVPILPAAPSIRPRISKLSGNLLTPGLPTARSIALVGRAGSTGSYRREGAGSGVGARDLDPQNASSVIPHTPQVECHDRTRFVAYFDRTSTPSL